jgi:hypothetical protein
MAEHSPGGHADEPGSAGVRWADETEITSGAGSSPGTGEPIAEQPVTGYGGAEVGGRAPAAASASDD